MNVISEFFTRYFDFKGRTSRKTYWLTKLFLFFVGIIVSYVIKNSILSLCWTIAIFIPSLAIEVRRLHDVNKSGVWTLINYIILIIAVATLIPAIISSATTLYTINSSSSIYSAISEGTEEAIESGELSTNAPSEEVTSIISSILATTLVAPSLLLLLISLILSIIIFIFTVLPSVNENNKYSN